MRTLPLAALLAAALAAVPGRSAAPPPRPARPDTIDLVLLHPARPLLVRLHLQVAGRPYQHGWNRTVHELFRFLDHDGNGLLDEKEVRQAPSRTQWQQMLDGGPVEPDAPPSLADLAGGEKLPVTLESFRRYYRDSGAGPL